MDDMQGAGHLEVLATPDGTKALGLMGRRLEPGDVIEILLWDSWERVEVFFIGPAPHIKTTLASARISPYAFLRWPRMERLLPN